MKVFRERELREAYAHAAEGGQALHLHTRVGPAAPTVFKVAMRRSEPVAHLIDNDVKRLHATARALGVRRIVIERQGEEGQHVDLCGEPLRKALEMAAQPELL